MATSCLLMSGRTGLPLCFGRISVSHKTPACSPQARRKSGRKENGKEEKKSFCWNLGKKADREEDNNFKPADSPHFQTASDTSWLILLG
jgi:hypothetical protein